MGLFHRKKQVEGARDQLRVKLGFWFRDRERYLAEYLNQKTKTFNFRTWLILLAGFCLITGGYLIYLLLGIVN